MEGTKVQFQVHESHISLWEKGSSVRYVILMGGRANGRSGTASRYIVSKLMGKEYVRGAVMRAIHSDIRASCWGELKDRLSEQGIADEFRVVDNDMYLERGQNSVRAHGFKASSGSLKARLKSLAGYNLVWIEEAEEIGEDDFRTLDDSLRTVKGSITVILTLNTPAKSHWILRRWFDMAPVDGLQGFYRPMLKADARDVLYIPGTFRENRVNLDQHTVDRYMAYKATKPNYYWQVIEGLAPEEKRGKIYTGWQQIDAVPPEARLVRGGEDFGWFPDPAALVAIYYWNGSYVVDQLAYGTELSNEYLAGEWKAVDAGRRIPLVADSAEPKSIAEQRKYGINVKGCEKGKDSVSFRIKVVSTKKVYVTKRSKDVWDSYENWHWLEDKDGNPTGEPDRVWKHAMDAVGYPISDLHNKPSDVVRPQQHRQRSNIAV